MILYHTPASLARAHGMSQEDVLQAVQLGRLEPVGFAGHPDKLIPLFDRQADPRQRPEALEVPEPEADPAPSLEEIKAQAEAGLESTRQLAAAIAERAPVLEAHDPAQVLEEDGPGETYHPHPDHGWSEPVRVQQEPAYHSHPSTPSDNPCAYPTCRLYTWSQQYVFCSRHWKLVPANLRSGVVRRDQRTIDDAIQAIATAL